MTLLTALMLLSIYLVVLLLWLAILAPEIMVTSIRWLALGASLLAIVVGSWLIFRVNAQKECKRKYEPVNGAVYKLVSE